MKRLKFFVLLFWYGLGAHLFLLIASVVWDKWGQLNWPFALSAVLGLLLVAVFFILIHLAFRDILNATAPETETPQLRSTDGPFPSSVTVWTGILILLITGGSLAAFFLSFQPPPWPYADLLSNPFPVTRDVQEALVTMFAAAVGSMITTILGYLEHASKKGDFKRSFVPWYAARPLMGMLLGLVFFLLLKGGLWTVAPAGQESQLRSNLNLYGLAGLGALVGLFSKNAIEKLRELFQSLFRTEKDMAQRLIRGLPKELQDEVRKHMEDFLDGGGEPPPPPSQPASPAPPPTPGPKS